MEGTVQLQKDPQVAFEVMEPVYWDAERAVATTFRTDEQTFFIGRSKHLCKVGETKIDVVLQKSVENGQQRDTIAAPAS